MREDNYINTANFIHVGGWMITELNLKGSELLIYAIIYGFSQAEGTYFTGSLQYLSDWTNTTKRNVIKTLNNLIEKKLLIKEESVTNGIKFCKYKAVRKSSLGVKKIHQDGEKSSPNNIDNNIDNIYSANFDINKAFDKFWDIYPRKTNKKKAKDLFVKKCPDENVLNKMIDAVINQKKSEQWQNIKYIPHATTWLNGERLEDEVIISDNIQNTEKNNSDDWMKEYE